MAKIPCKDMDEHTGRLLVERRHTVHSALVVDNSYNRNIEGVIFRKMFQQPSRCSLHSSWSWCGGDVVSSSRAHR